MKVLYNEQTVSTSGDRYMDLAGLPMINSVPLIGNKTSSELNMYTKNEIDSMVSSMQAVQVVEILPALPDPCTLYYVGTEAPYQVVFFDKNRVRHDMGESSVDLSVFQKIVDATLKTTSKNVVGAINEIDTDVGNVATLKTTNKIVVPGINELYDRQGNVGSLTTTNKTNLVSAINELDKEVGDISKLKTSVKTNLVDAVNTLKTNSGVTYITVANRSYLKEGFAKIVENYKKDIITYMHFGSWIFTPTEINLTFDSSGNMTSHKIVLLSNTYEKVSGTFVPAMYLCYSQGGSTFDDRLEKYLY